ncbi:hypothetical protein HHK36_032272 [Tetracentron sinense]|uniref:Nudix hydrolase domain-containing protein n=1 Tax=Tetracentron sinense TaxID=13715 RepID=A0A835CZP3_TETSI|nr:hypothetical protein HHK36_032272 [Tetracentron sinense]
MEEHSHLLFEFSSSRLRVTEQPHGITCKENLLKECKEEAGIPRLICILSNCTPLVQFVLNIHGYLLQLGCIAESYPSCLTELKLPDGFIPKNQEFDLCTFYCLNSHATDGEVASFKLIPVMHVANIIRRCLICAPFIVSTRMPQMERWRALTVAAELKEWRLLLSVVLLKL